MPDSHRVVDILLIEDNPTDAELCMRVLKKNGLANNVVWVKDGAEALDFIFATGAYSDREVVNAPKVILLDLRLPKIDGLEVLEKIKADDRTRLIPTVIMTTSKEERDIAASYRLGGNSFINKPIAFEEFAEVVVRLGMYWLLVNHVPVAVATA